MPSAPPIRLGVNVDHVATVRNARGGTLPDPVRAAKLAIEAGADGITAHLREDRRHIRDDDMERLKAEITKPLNFEMAATDEMVAIALRIGPHAVCLVPEKREERTTEGGLDVAGNRARIANVTQTLKVAGIRVSLFVEADPKQIEAAVAVGAPVIEIHTGTLCEYAASGNSRAGVDEWSAIQYCAREGAKLGLEVHAGHGLDYWQAEQIARIPQIAELNIGHFLVGEAIFVGLDNAVRKMREAMQRGREELLRE